MVTPTTALRRVTAPAVMPVTVGDVKEQCRVDGDDEETYIADLIAAAVAVVDARGILGRCMINQTWAEYFPNAPGEVRLSMTPFVSLTSVKYYDSAGALQTATNSDYELIAHGDYVILRPKEGFEWPEADVRQDAYQITYVAGFGAAASDVPASIRHAVKLIAAHWYQNREIAGANMSEMPMMASDILNTERLSWYGG